MKKILIIIISTALFLFGGIVYYFYINNSNQIVNSENIFTRPQNYFPFSTTSSQIVIPIQTNTSTSSDEITKKNTVATNKTTVLPTQGTRIVTNGITDPGIDYQYKNNTTYQQDGKNLDATTDNYVTVPKNTVPIGSRVYILNQNTGLDVWGVVGDIGPYGGISLYAVEQLGMWQEGMGMNLLPHKLIIKYYLK